MSRVLLTAKGAETLREELKRLRSVDRPRVIEAIAEARAHGDLSENAEFEAAKDEQGFIINEYLEDYSSIKGAIQSSVYYMISRY